MMTLRSRVMYGAAMVLLLAADPCLGLDTVYLVRHAEKAPFWPDDLSRYRPLSAAGTRRAEALAGILGDAGVLAIYATGTTRTLATGMPLAERAGVSISISDASADLCEMDRFLAGLGERHTGPGAVLIAGHSNTVPQLLRRLGAEPGCYARLGIVEIPGGQLRIEGYDGLWSIDLREEGCQRIARRSQREATGR